MNQPPPKDDLFEKSTMTFGEHLDELRKALMKSAVWLAGGLAIGLFFAADVVKYVQDPLEVAIKRFMADQTLFKLDIDPKSEAAREQREWLVEKGLVLETIYVADEAALSQMQAVAPAKKSEEQTDSSEEKKQGPVSEGNDENVSPALQEGDEGTEDLSTEEDESTEEAPQIATFDTSSLKPMKIWRPVEAGLSSFQMEETFMIWLKAGLVVGLVFASPGIFYHLWQFVAAGLYTHERKYVYIYMPFSVVLFVSGVALAFFLVLKYVLDFLLQFNTAMNVDLVPRLSNYVNFVLLLPVGFGIAFQLPLVMLFLQRIGLFETQMYTGSWRIAVLVIAVLSMILTPADIYSMIALMVPLIMLYFLGIGLCKYMPKGRGIGSEGYDPV